MVDQNDVCSWNWNNKNFERVKVKQFFLSKREGIPPFSQMPKVLSSKTSSLVIGLELGTFIYFDLHILKRLLSMIDGSENHTSS